MSILITIMAAWTVAAAQGFDATSRTVTVAPSGGDDTAAIGEAFRT